MSDADRLALERWVSNLRDASEATLKRGAADTLCILRATLANATRNDDDRDFIVQIVDPLIAELRRRAAAEELPDVTPRGRA